MKHLRCPQEPAVTKAVHTGNLEKSLTTHASTCAVCREIIQTANWMQDLARSPESKPTLPNASLVWWRAQLSEKQAQAGKAQDFLEWVEFTSAAAISLGLAVWLIWNWYAVQRLITWISAGANSWATAYSMPFFFPPIIAVLCSVALVLAYPILADE
jgi:hypothetical protein